MELNPIIEIGAVIGSAATLITLVLRPIYRFHMRVLKAVHNTDLILVELGTNGGASLRDSVDRVESAVTFQDLRARALIQDADHGYVETDALGNLTFANRTYLRWTGRSLGEVEEQGWHNIISEHDRSRVVSEWEKAVEGRRHLTITFGITGVDGDEIEVIAHCYKIQTRPGGSLLGWACVIHTVGGG